MIALPALSGYSVETGMKMRRAFSIIELLVVIGVIAVFLGLLVPALSPSRRSARSLQCKSNLRELGHALRMYANVNNGWFYPVGYEPFSGDFMSDAFGTRVPPHERWPMTVFKVRAPNPLPYNPAAYDQSDYDPQAFPAAPFTPAVLVCPADVDPEEAHSYVVNGHIADYRHRTGGTGLGGKSGSSVILAGEKRSWERDYYMQSEDFARVVEPFRHGIHLRSNYLYLDGHVDNATPKDALNGIDPWDVAAAP
jgi:prepilin-type processing-associated H-X9-DG protein